MEVPKFGFGGMGGQCLETTLGNIEMISRVRPVDLTPTRDQQVRRLYKVGTRGGMEVPKFGFCGVGGPWIEATLGNIEMISRIKPVDLNGERGILPVFGHDRVSGSLCQRLGLTRSVRNKPRARSASIECRRCESPPEAKDERSESFTGGARGFAKQNLVFEHTHLPLCRPGVSIQRNHYQKMN